jgi:hypothetical protein
MYYIKLINKNGETFCKNYDSYYIYNKDLAKYKNGKNIKIISYGERW